MSYVVDRSGVLSNARRTATGGYLVDATLAKVGVLEYAEDTGIVRHYNSPEVLLAALDGLGTVPVTNRHPAQMVTTDTYQKVVAGHIFGQPVFEDGHVKATLAINDAKLISDIELGVAREVSMGYEVQTAKADSADYDVVRTSIVWNHCAVVPSGRAGKSVRLLLDSSIPNDEEAQVFKINGVEVAEDSAQAAIDSLEGQLAAAAAELETLKAAVAVSDAALAMAVSDAAIDAAVQARIERDAAVAAKAAKLARVAAGYPSIALDGKSDDFVDALSLALDAKDAADPEGLRALQDRTPVVVAPVVVADAVPVESARERMIRANREAIKAAQ